MAIRFDIGHKEKTFHVEADADLSGTKIGDKVKGESIKPEFVGYEFKITGASDNAGFPARVDVEGVGRKKILLKKGVGMKEKGKGLVLRKSVRGNTIASDIAQINLKVTKEGKKPLADILSGKVSEISEIKKISDDSQESKILEAKEVSAKKEEKK